MAALMKKQVTSTVSRRSTVVVQAAKKTVSTKKTVSAGSMVSACSCDLTPNNVYFCDPVPDSYRFSL